MRPIIIGIGGAHSGAGKTTYAAMLLGRLKGWGAIKYTRTAIYCSIIDDVEVLSKENKDTERLLSSGAKRVLWVQSPATELGEVLPAAVERLSDLNGIVVEGNSAVEFLRPDIIIFIFGSDPCRIKESAKKVLDIADIVVYRGSNEFAVRGKSSVSNSLSSEGLIDCIIEMVERKDRIRSAIKEKAVDGRLPCPLARKIARELSVPFKEVGEAADELEVKITDCELGCF